MHEYKCVNEGFVPQVSRVFHINHLIYKYGVLSVSFLIYHLQKTGLISLIFERIWLIYLGKAQAYFCLDIFTFFQYGVLYSDAG